MNRKHVLTVFSIMLAVLAAGILIASRSHPLIPPDAVGKVRLYTRNKPKAEITVAVLSDAGTDIFAFGHDGIQIPVPDRFYELGDVTMTFTGAIAAKAITDGKLSPYDRLGDILPLSRAAYSPTVYELLTHSSAYSAYAPDISGVFSRRGNPYSGITSNDLVREMDGFKLSYKPPYLYSYSRFGAAAVGAILSQIYDVDFYSILTIFAREELGLKHTFISLDESVRKGWIWKNSDAYIASSSLASTIGDMVAYARLYLNDAYDFLSLAGDATYEVNAENSMGYFWNLSDRGRILWHAGETGHYASALMIDRVNRIAVIVLSNYGNDRFGSAADIAGAFLREKREANY